MRHSRNLAWRKKSIPYVWHPCEPLQWTPPRHCVPLLPKSQRRGYCCGIGPTLVLLMCSLGGLLPYLAYFQAEGKGNFWHLQVLHFRQNHLSIFEDSQNFCGLWYHRLVCSSQLPDRKHNLVIRIFLVQQCPKPTMSHSDCLWLLLSWRNPHRS